MGVKKKGAVFLPALKGEVSTPKKLMKIDLGTKKVAVKHISKVVAIGSHTAAIHFIFGNAIQVRCCPSEFVDAPTYKSIFHFDGTPTELRQLVKRLKSEA